MIDIIILVESCPVYVYALVIAGFMLNNTVVVSSMVSLISLWYPLMHRDLYDIWFLGSNWLTRVKGDLITLVLGSKEPFQQPSSEWV